MLVDVIRIRSMVILQSEILLLVEMYYYYVITSFTVRKVKASLQEDDGD